MRVLLSKSYRPSICFSKSSLCIYPPCNLKLEDVHHVSSSSAPVSEAVEDNKSSEERIDVKEADILLKSILKKSLGSGKKEVGKVRVKWMDFVGKELAEIREFESFESGESEDIGNAGSQACICAIQ